MITKSYKNRKRHTFRYFLGFIALGTADALFVRFSDVSLPVGLTFLALGGISTVYAINAALRIYESGTAN